MRDRECRLVHDGRSASCACRPEAPTTIDVALAPDTLWWHLASPHSWEHPDGPLIDPRLFALTVPDWAQSTPGEATPTFVTFDGAEVDGGLRILAPVELYATTPERVPDDYVAYLLARTENGATFDDVVESTVNGRRAYSRQPLTDRCTVAGCPEAGIDSHDCCGLKPNLRLRLTVVDDGDQRPSSSLNMICAVGRRSDARHYGPRPGRPWFV